MNRTRKTPRNPRRPAPVGAPPTDGTAAQVRDWVGNDPRRAQVAYDAENARGEDARSSLLTQLRRVGAKDGV